MDSAPPDHGEINGFNLANYFPQQTLNSVIYVHKRFLNAPKIKRRKEGKIKSLDKTKREKRDKCQQVGCDKICSDTVKGHKNANIGVHNASVMEQTIRFAKDIVPLVIPTGRDKSPLVFYTIKTLQKAGRKKKARDAHADCPHGANCKNDKSKKLTETYTKHLSNKESLSAKGSSDHYSENNTIDDFNINHSMSCTLSEVSEAKYHSKRVHRNRRIDRRTDPQKFAVSESFEALATEMNLSGETKIKIHLMNDRDKNFLSESIRVPVLNAIKDCIAELGNGEVSTEVKTAQRFIKCNTQKLDCILDRLSSIEQILNNRAKDTLKSPRVTMKASTLEQLSVDLIEVNQNSFDDVSPTLSERKRRSDPVVEFVEEKKPEGGCGEVGLKAPRSGKLDRPNRLPARFCWTDADRKNVPRGNSRQSVE